MGRYTGTPRMWRLLHAAEHFRDCMERAALDRPLHHQGILVHKDPAALRWQWARKAYHRVWRQLLDMAWPADEVLKSLKENPLQEQVR